MIETMISDEGDAEQCERCGHWPALRIPPMTVPLCAPCYCDSVFTEGSNQPRPDYPPPF